MHIVYAYLRNQFKQSGNGFMQLILMHIVSFLLFFLFKTGCYICGCENYSSWIYRQLIFPSLYPLLLERPWTIITYSFIHKCFLDVFWDVLMLYVFGQRILAITRSKHILWIYFLGQIVGAIVFCMLYQFSPPFRGISADLVGPSSAVYAIMVAACVLIPNLSLYCFFFYIQLKHIALALLVISLMHLPTQDAGYYLAQLGGSLVGYVYARIYRNNLDTNSSFFSSYSLRGTKVLVRFTKK